MAFSPPSPDTYVDESAKGFKPPPASAYVPETATFTVQKNGTDPLTTPIAPPSTVAGEAPAPELLGTDPAQPVGGWKDVQNTLATTRLIPEIPKVTAPAGSGPVGKALEGFQHGFANLINSIGTPEGAATVAASAGIAGLAPQAAKAVGAAWALYGASQVPSQVKQIEQAKGVSQTVEGVTGLASNVFLSTLAGIHAANPEFLNGIAAKGREIEKAGLPATAKAFEANAVKEAVVANMPTPELRPALQVGDVTIKGEVGDNHAAILDRLVKNDHPQAGEAAGVFGDNKSHVFTDQSGAVYDRKLAGEIADAHGLRPDEQRGKDLHSEQLHAYQPEKAEGGAQEPAASPAAKDEGVPAGMGVTEGSAGGEKESEPETIGIAQRVRETRAGSGRADSTATGQGWTGEEAIQRGRDLMQQGVDPQKVLSDFRETGVLTGDSMAVARAEDERLSKASDAAADQFGTSSPEYKAAFGAEKDWLDKVKTMQTESSRVFSAQQGETEIDTGTFHGLARAFLKDTGKEFTPEQETKAKSIASNVNELGKATEATKQKLYDTLQTTFPFHDDSISLSPDQNPAKLTDPKALAEYFADRPEGKLTPQEAAAIWNHAKTNYLDKGETDYDDIRHGVSQDLGITPKQVGEAFTSNKTLRTISDQMYDLMSKRRKAIQDAKTWLKTANTPAITRVIKALPDAFFAAKVFGHGTVGMITHAGANIFRPTKWGEYWPNFAKQFKFAYGPRAGYEQAIQDLLRDPDYIPAKRAGVAVDPTKAYSEYQRASKLFGSVGEIGNRGFDALKTYRLEMWKNIMKAQPPEVRADPAAGKAFAQLVNHSTGVSNLSLPKFAEWIPFAAKLEGSRWARLAGDPLKTIGTYMDWKNASPGERAVANLRVRRAAEFAATYYTLLAANQGLLKATGSKEDINFTDPTQPDWMRFKAGGKTIDVSGGLTSTIGFLASLVKAAVEPKPEGGRTRADNEYHAIGKYARGKLGPLASTIADVTTQRDFSGRPLPFSKDKPYPGQTRYSWPEYLFEQQTPIPVSDAVRNMVETMQSRGMSKPTIKDFLSSLLDFGIVGGTGARVVKDVSRQNRRTRK